MELTTGIAPKTAAAMLYTGGKALEILNDKASKALDRTAKEFAEHMEDLYDTAT